MMRSLAVVIALLALAAHVDAASMVEVRQHGVAKFAVTSSSPPHEFLDAPSNTLKGAMIDIAQAIAADWGVKAEFLDVPSSALIPTLTSRRADVMAAPVFITAERADVLEFSDPVYGWGEGLVVAEGRPADYSGAASLTDNTVGCLAGSPQFEMLKTVHGIKDVRTYPSHASLLADLRAGRIDVAMIAPPSITHHLAATGITGVKLVESYTPSNAWTVGLAVNTGDSDVLDAVNVSLRKLKQSGQLRKILDGWGLGGLIAN
jgi:polar amino acid transport system substrate-binding protein